ncbi:phage tail assembly protein [Caballeronia sordidicola]|uniref:Tail assembly chaperone E/41/14-like protein n=1 Tax=Caballeronia sordidicola TaxID=196367 RepID=A0A242N7B3_CABSO|nr:phage tail assembly protein [Caballeronia sordidicola]OTP79493.1 hypothetical protein PAMC26577_01100 [Caballeronia sordidicola]
MSETKTFTLKKPVTIGKEDAARTFDQFVMREPIAGEFEEAEKLGRKYGYDVALVSIVSGVPVDAIDLMGVTMVDAAMDFVATFTPEDMGTASVQDEKRLELRVPAKIGSGDDAPTYAVMNLSEPTNLQRRKANEAGGPWATVVSLVSRNAQIPLGAVRSMCARDFLEASQFYAGFQRRHDANAND